MSLVVISACSYHDQLKADSPSQCIQQNTSFLGKHPQILPIHPPVEKLSEEQGGKDECCSFAAERDRLCLCSVIFFNFLMQPFPFSWFCFLLPRFTSSVRNEGTGS